MSKTQLLKDLFILPDKIKYKNAEYFNIFSTLYFDFQNLQSLYIFDTAILFSIFYGKERMTKKIFWDLVDQGVIEVL